MDSQLQHRRCGTRFSLGVEDDKEEGRPKDYFSEELRKFKNYSRNFHEYYAQAEGAHGTRSFDRDEINVLNTIVMNACHYLERLEGSSKTWSHNHDGECTEIVDYILKVSESMVGKSGKVNLEVVFLTMYMYSSKEMSLVPLFKIYGNSRDDFVFISKQREKYVSLFSFLDEEDLPHSLVCAARESPTKTYEIDDVTKKYPLVFVTVNSYKFCDRTIHKKVWSKVIKNTIILDLPFLLVQALLHSLSIEVKYFTYNVNWNVIPKKSMKYKFIKFMEKFADFIPIFGTYVNNAIVMAFCFSFNVGAAWENELGGALILNGNKLSKNTIPHLINCIASPVFFEDVSKISSDLFGNSFNGSFLGTERPFTYLISELKEGKDCSRTVNHCSEIIEYMILLGEKVLDIFAVTAKQKLILLGLKVMSRITLILIRIFNNKSRPRNYIDDGKGYAASTPDDGNYSLDNFLKTIHTKNNILDLIGDDEIVARLIERECRECARDDSKFICINENENVYISLGPTSAVIEQLLEKSNKNARVYASEDNSFYVILTEEASWKIYPSQNDKLNEEIQYIYVKKR